MDAKKKVNLPNKELKRVKDPLEIIVVRQVIHQTNVGVMEKKNSMENATIVVSMVTRLMNAIRNQNLRESVTSERNKMKDEIDGKNNEIQNQSLQQANLIDQISNANEEIKSLRIEN